MKNKVRSELKKYNKEETRYIVEDMVYYLIESMESSLRLDIIDEDLYSKVRKSLTSRIKELLQDNSVVLAYEE